MTCQRTEVVHLFRLMHVVGVGGLIYLASRPVIRTIFHTTIKPVCRTLTAMRILSAEYHKYEKEGEKMSGGRCVPAIEKQLLT